MRLPLDNKESDGPNLTPVIDIVFLLLIFFLVATRLNQEELTASINLAEILEAQPLTAGVPELIVNIDKDGKYIISGKTINEPTLAKKLKKEHNSNPQRKVQIRADQDVKFRYPLTVMGICKANEIEYSCTVLEKKKP